jgi:DNA-binding CsgD family transcriptional regulator
MNLTLQRRALTVDFKVAGLTKREHQACILITIGYQTKEIADILGISSKTAEKHRSRVMRIARVGTSRLAHWAIERGIITAEEWIATDYVPTPNLPKGWQTCP